MRQPELWKRLVAYQFDAETGSEPFSVKLAVQEGWPPEYTSDVIEEYRRFLYLTQVSEGQATPSQDIDRAWHMHLTFTRDYWQRLCRDVLQAELHHDPCAGAEEMQRYEAQYQATKALYREEFGGEPDHTVWPEHAPERPGRRPYLAIALAVTGLLFLLYAALGHPGGEIPSLSLIGIGMLIVGSYLSKGGIRKSGRSEGGGGGTAGGCGGCGGGGG